MAVIGGIVIFSEDITASTLAAEALRRYALEAEVVDRRVARVAADGLVEEIGRAQRAMELIEQLEVLRRGVYGGAVGYFDFGGDMDACIAIRTAVVAKGGLHIQAGAGIVFDSLPESELAE